jgi:CheY-like chemotaxis protein
MGTTMPQRILIADDETEFCNVVQRMLQEEGYETDVAYDGCEVLDAVEVCKPDLIVLDALMPRLDGFCTLRCLRTNPATRDIAVIMLSARDESAFVRQAWESDVDLFVSKPVSRDELTSLVARVLADKLEARFREDGVELGSSR